MSLTVTSPTSAGPAIFEQIPRGARAGRRKADVIAQQRQRMCMALLALLADGEEVNIRAICKLARVSSKTFYERFGASSWGLEDCLLGAYELLMDRAITGFGDACAQGRGKAPIRRAFRAFTAELEQPAAVRRALADVAARNLVRPQRPSQEFTKLISRSFAAGPGGVALSSLTCEAIVAGIERVARGYLFVQGEQQPSLRLAGQLAAWALSYRDPAVEQLDAVALEDIEERSPREFSSTSIHARILEVTAEIATSAGLWGLTVERIAETAGVSVETVEEMYGSSEACLLAAVRRCGLQALVCAADAAKDDSNRIVSVHHAIAGLMAAVARDPVLVRLVFVELGKLDGGCIHREALIDTFTNEMRRKLPASHRPTDVALHAIGGAICGLVEHHVRGHTINRLPRLAGDASYLALAPVIGGSGAVAVISIHSQRTRCLPEHEQRPQAATPADPATKRQKANGRGIDNPSLLPLAEAGDLQAVAG